MAHGAGRCNCGRKIRFPKGSTLGAAWECWTCGKVWRISTQGKPLHKERSKSPPANAPVATGGGGCLGLILIVAMPTIAFSVWFLVAPA